MLRAALTGISGVIGRRGEVLTKIGLGRPGVIAERVAGAGELTPYVRFPWIVPLLSALVTVSAIFRAWTKDRRKRHAIDRAC
jgi:apolipoprotein N-acyltransferase